jgi:hypothetical protein
MKTLNFHPFKDSLSQSSPHNFFIYYWQEPVGYILYHLGLPNEFQNPKDQFNTT